MAKKIKFKFTIEERLRRSVTIDAENEREAREIVLKKYGDGDIVFPRLSNPETKICRSMTIPSLPTHLRDDICEATGYAWEQIIGRQRHQHIADSRIIITAYLHAEGYSFSAIAKILHRHHATIIHSINRFIELKQTDKAFNRRAEQIFTHLETLRLKIMNHEEI